MNIAIVGTGFIAEVHARELVRMGLRPVLAVGRDEEHTAAFARRWEIPNTSTDPRCLTKEQLHAVHICTPPALHYEMAKELIGHGIHVICEKPLCLDASRARELMELARQKRVIGAVNFNVRYHQQCREMKRRLQEGEAGRILYLKGSYEQAFHILPAPYSWRYEPALAGKMRAMTEIGSHWIDLARFVSGLTVTEVSASFGSFFPDRSLQDGWMTLAGSDEDRRRSPAQSDSPAGSEGRRLHVDSEDVVSATLRLTGGVMANLFLSEISHGRSNRLTLEVTGTEKAFRWNSERPYQLESAQGSSGVLTESDAFTGGYPDTFSAFFEEVYHEIKSGQPSKEPAFPTFRDGYYNAAVCEAVWQSAVHNSAWTRTGL